MAKPVFTRLRVTGEWHEIAGNLKLWDSLNITIGDGAGFTMRQVVQWTGADGQTYYTTVDRVEAWATDIQGG